MPKIHFENRQWRVAGSYLEPIPPVGGGWYMHVRDILDGYPGYGPLKNLAGHTWVDIDALIEAWEFALKRFHSDFCDETYTRRAKSEARRIASSRPAFNSPELRRG